MKLPQTRTRSNWTGLYLSVILYTAALVVLLYLLTRWLDFSLP